MNPRRLAACDPCRASKVACDHAQPCGRCKVLCKADSCTYRDRPFKRRRIDKSGANHQADQEWPDYSGSVVSPEAALLNSSALPTPNHQAQVNAQLAAASHVSIFRHLDESGDTVVNDVSPHTNSHLARKTAEIVEIYLKEFPWPGLKSLIAQWRATGSNLALAELITDSCVDAVGISLASTSKDQPWPREFERPLLRNSQRGLAVSTTSTISDFIHQFTGRNIRWETTGVFFAAVVRASFETTVFPRLYEVSSQRVALISRTVELLDALTEMCLSFDCMDELRLILQYENFIAHSYVAGIRCKFSWPRPRMLAAANSADRSPAYRTQRKLGDMLTSIFSLGFHDARGCDTGDAPFFLVQLRLTLCARLYSADKNYAVILGRPPRMSKRFCHLHLPLGISCRSESMPSHNSTDIIEWKDICYRSESRWSALCAELKEEILEMFSCQDRNDTEIRTRYAPPSYCLEVP